MPPLYLFSAYFGTFIDTTAARQMRKFYDLAAKPNMPADEVARQCNGQAAPSWELVKSLAQGA
jgi:hypothetical protein